MKQIFPLILLFCASVLPADANSLSSEQFVKALRTPSSGETWGRLTGTVQHRRKGAEPVEAPISFRTLLTMQSSIAQLIFRNTEICQLTQSRVAPFASSVEINGKSTLADVGLRPSDLVMDFIYWKFVKELPRTNLRMQDCRVLLFESEKTKETVRVFANAAHLFPVKVEWFQTGQTEGKPFRTLEVSGFKQIGELWLVEELSVYGPGWRTMIHFDKTEAGFQKDGIPKDLFVE